MAVHVGQRKFDDDWDPVDEQTAVGIQFDRHDPSALLGYELGLFVSRKRNKNLDPGPDGLGNPGDDFEISGLASDLSLGLRKTFSKRDAHLYIGAGIAYSYAKIKVDPPQGSTDKDSDDSLGFYARAGVYWSVRRNALFGLDYRVLTGTDNDLDHVDDADSSIVSLFLGYSF